MRVDDVARARGAAPSGADRSRAHDSRLGWTSASTLRTTVPSAFAISTAVTEDALAQARSEALYGALRLVAPGTPLREGIDRILQAKMGALIVVGDGPEVLDICSGGFLLDAEFTPQRLSELAKMDGAIILAADGSRVARANVHLVPDPDIPTRETGTRHRTAERVARQIDVPVITVSEEMGVVIGPLPGLQEDARADPARARPRRPGAADPRPLQGAARRGERRALGARGRRPRDRSATSSTVLQRAEMVRRIADEIEGYVVELGADGGWSSSSSRSSPAGSSTTGGSSCKDYFVARPERGARRTSSTGSPSSTTRTCSTCAPSPALLGLPRRARPRLVGAARAATACSPRSRGCPRRSPSTSSSGSATCRRSCARASPISSRSKASARRARRAIKDGLARVAESSILDRYA